MSKTWATMATPSGNVATAIITLTGKDEKFLLALLLLIIDRNYS